MVNSRKKKIKQFLLFFSSFVVYFLFLLMWNGGCFSLWSVNSGCCALFRSVFITATLVSRHSVLIFSLQVTDCQQDFLFFFLLVHVSLIKNNTKINPGKKKNLCHVIVVVQLLDPRFCFNVFGFTKDNVSSLFLITRSFDLLKVLSWSQPLKDSDPVQDSDWVLP